MVSRKVWTAGAVTGGVVVIVLYLLNFTTSSNQRYILAWER